MKIIYNYIKSLYRKFIFPASIKLSKNTSVIDLIKNFNYDIKTIIEIGASNGRYTKILKNKFPKSFIFCIEANKDLKDNFLKNTINCKNVSLEAIGIGSKNEIKTFYKNNDSDTNSLLKPLRNVDSKIDKFFIPKSTEKIKVTTIDDFCKSKNIKQIDLLKIDIQGGELEALKGSINLLKNKLIKVIYLEVNFIEMYQNCPFFSDIDIFLKGFEYQCFGVYNLDYGKNDRILYGDAIYILK
jgi:FkbM family methyltransferase